MCGIAGIFDPHRRIEAARLQEVAAAMAARLVHRGPDDHGAWVSDDGLCALAHRRLTVIDVSVAGRQPMRDQRGALVVSFNGEIYNYRELRSELTARGRDFSTRTDTEVLIEAFAAFGEGVYAKLEGMYAFAIFDSENRRLTLARDPFGEKPLYYTTQAGAFAFASELQALYAVPWFEPDVRVEAIAEYLALQYVQSPGTIYRDTFKVDSGAWLQVEEDGHLRHARHFTYDPDGSVEGGGIETHLDELDEAVTTAVRRCMVSDVPLGTFLSSGVDSSLVTAIAQRHSAEPLRTFSIGFAGARESEHQAASETADFLGCRHSTQLVSSDALERLPAIAAAMDEPNGDVSCLPTYFLCALARGDVKVALSGDGGDELFGGYETYQSLVPAKEGGTAASAAALPVGAAYLRMMTTFSRDEIAQLLGAMPRETDELLSSLSAMVAKDDRPLVSRLRLADSRSFLPGSVLPKVDRMSMAHSLEVRCPLLSRSIAGIAARLRPEECLANGSGKVLLRRLASRYLPRDWMDRPKKGFGFPAGWLPAGAVLAKATEHFGNHPKLRNWMGSSNLERFLQRQGSDVTSNPSQVWRLLILELWLQSHALGHVSSRDSGAQPLLLSSQSPDPLVLKGLAPCGTDAGVPFNVQANGSAALAVSCAHAGPWTSIVIDGEQLPTTFGGASELTALVPGKFYSRPGARRVCLMDGDRLSNGLDFQVLPALEASPLVTVVIPCFNQGRFLAEAVGSALGQTHGAIEVIVVDDGSSDETKDVAAGFESVHYIRQSNQGLPAARNRGLDEARGEFVIFLDADDRLLPTAAELGLRAIRGAPSRAFAFGHYRSITDRGAVLIEAPPRVMGEDAYAAFLGGNLVGTTASAIFRTAILREAGGFDCSPQFWGCEDYGLYLRLSREFPVARYLNVVAEYRLHASSMSRNAVRMMSSIVSLLESHRSSVRGNPRWQAALANGLRTWRESFVPDILADLVARRRQSRAAAFRHLMTVGRLAPREVVTWGTRIRCSGTSVFRVNEETDAPGTQPSSVPSPPSGIRLFPSGTSPGQHFNLQGCGMSALAVECPDAQPRSVVVFGETPLLTTYGSPTLLTALVPAELYDRPGAFPVYVVGFRRRKPRP